MQILCEIKRFKEIVKRGRFTGQTTEYNISVGGDNYSWNISRVNLSANAQPLGQKYFKGFCHLLADLENFDINAKDAVVNILAGLESNTEIKPSEELLELIKSSDDLKEIGVAIDNHYKCNYNCTEHDTGKLTDPNRIYVRVLKANLKTASKDNG